MIPIDFTGKVALVTGVGDNDSFAWYIAKALQAAGAKLVLACHPRVVGIVESFLSRDADRDSATLIWPGGGRIRLVENLHQSAGVDRLELEGPGPGQELTIAGARLPWHVTRLGCRARRHAYRSLAAGARSQCHRRADLRAGDRPRVQAKSPHEHMTDLVRRQMPPKWPGSSFAGSSPAPPLGFCVS